MKLFCLIDTTTNLPLRLAVESTTKGQAYMTYEVPEFSLELSNDYNKELPVWTTDNESLAQEIAAASRTSDRKNKDQNLDNPNCYVFTEGEIVVKPLTIAA